MQLLAIHINHKNAEVILGLLAQHFLVCRPIKSHSFTVSLTVFVSKLGQYTPI